MLPIGATVEMELRVYIQKVLLRMGESVARNM